MAVVVAAVLVACGGGARGVAGPTGVPAPSIQPWPFSFETYSCSARVELDKLGEEVKALRADVKAGDTAGIIEVTKRIDDRLDRAIGYLAQMPDWGPGERFSDLLRAATRHYREGTSLLAGARVDDDEALQAALEPLERGNGSVRKTDRALEDLAAETGFEC